MNPEEFVQKYAHLVERAARKEHRESRLFTVEDLQQEIWVALLPYTRKLAGQGEAFIYSSAVHAAARYAERERTDHQYFQGIYIYTPETVRTELEAGAWQAEVTGDWDMRLDIRNAYDALPGRERSLLFSTYMLGNPPAHGSADHKAMHRAVDKMTHWLNGKLALEIVELDHVA